MERREVLQYVADMTAQLSELCRGHIPFISELLAFAAVIVQREIED